MKKYSAIIGFSIAAFCLLSIAATPGYAYTVYPDDPYWGPDARTTANDGTEDDINAGTVEISSEEPRSGNASLKLTVGGDADTLDDWAFYTRTTDEEGGWGLLEDVSALSFDWFRATATDESYASYDPWNLQTPVLRLLIYDSETENYNELVWEQYYTDIVDFPDDYDMLVGQWVTENLLDQYFWSYVVDEGYVITDIEGDTYISDDYGDDPSDVLVAMTLSEWLASVFYSDSAYIYGISLGVGSSWPGEYLGYVDNVLLAFGTDSLVLNDNFELPVPEPSTMLLLGTCLATFLAGRRRRARG